MSQDQRSPTYGELVALVGDLREQNELLRAEVADLKVRSGVNSRDSSKPPSSEGLAKPIASKSLRGKPGGQGVHEGRTLRQVVEPDRAAEHRPAACGGCGAGLADAPVVGSKNKVSGGLRSLEGAERYPMLRSQLQTAAKHGLTFLDALKLACAGMPWLLPHT